MRICVVVSDFPKVTETFVIANALHYLRAGHDVSVFHLKAFREDEVMHKHAQPVIATGFTFPWVWGASLSGLGWAMARPRRFVPLLGQILRAFAGEPRRLAATLALLPKSCAFARWADATRLDHIHAEFAGYPATAAWIAARLTDVPYSFSAHAHDIFLSQAGLMPKAQDARFVRVISDFNRRFLAALPGFPADKLQVLRCGVDVSGPTALPPEPAAGAPWRLVFVGALLPRKGVDDLLSALALLPPDLAWHLDILGGGRLDATLREQAAALGMSNVTFHGPQPSDAVRAAMQAAHLVLVPSREGAGGRSEGIPVVLMEALSHARPVIASNLSGIPELVEDGVTGRLCPPGAPRDLAAAIIELLGNWPEARAMGERGRARVARDYNISQNAAALLAQITRHSGTVQC